MIVELKSLGRRFRSSKGPAAVRHIAIVASALLLLLLTREYSFRDATLRVESAFQHLVPKRRQMLCRDDGEVAPTVEKVAAELLPGLLSYPATETERRRIADQAVKVQRLECMHADLLKGYIANSYMSLVVSIVFGAISAVALFFMSSKGWSASSNYLVTVLVTSGAIAAFFGAFPGMFQQPVMVTANRVQVVRYEALLDGMASHVVAPRIIPVACLRDAIGVGPRVCEQRYSSAEFIACTDAALAALELPFALDPDAAPNYARSLGGSQ
ncbi:hypothetical protein [Sabulicella rubraurantiaca]|uniref:hypothetical protein n=1 Tax=Sabulicella rubraurantiaca TaxID=2811429 RepID=UPI001A97AFE4|nr:hypothetical protein [Sabulicella rubraurantiaca]